ncbi:hypothetical protein [Streptomyces griseofuscus]|uniref:hypothetical protein n=1 Tax=Streptomyces griseofuscus TaxID=146922 RepID=UPI0033F9512D
MDVDAAGGVLDVAAGAGEGRARHRHRGDPEAGEILGGLEHARSLRRRMDGVTP